MFYEVNHVKGDGLELYFDSFEKKGVLSVFKPVRQLHKYIGHEKRHTVFR